VFDVQTATLALSCIGLLALAILGIARSTRSTLGLRLALLCLDLFAWESASLAHEVSGHQEWRWLNVTLSPLTAPLALEFVLAFTGRARRSPLARQLVWAAFGLLSFASGLAFIWPPARAFAGSALWAKLYLGGLAAVLLPILYLLVRHLREAGSPEERQRGRLLLWAIAVGGLFGSTNLLNDLWPAIPGLGALGLLLASSLTALVALRFQLLDRDLSRWAALAALAVASGGVLVHLGSLKAVGPELGVGLLSGAALGLGLLAAARSLATRAALEKVRLSQLAFLGRFSAQMAHDLKNPLSALKGAAQFLAEEETREDASAEKRRFTGLMLEQIERVERVIERYQRLSRVEARRAPLELNALVLGVVALQPFAAGPVAIRTELTPDLPAFEGDADLLAGALENLVRNAFEAMPSGGSVTVSTAHDQSVLLLAVADSGPGMDARTSERAFDEFFSTKETGSGLGLPFVLRVAEAHGGEVRLLSAQPHGTVVQLRFPLSKPLEPGRPAV